MDHKRIFVLVSIMLPFLHNIAAVAVVSLTQETPCLLAQSCRLRCSVVSGNNVNGLGFLRDQMTPVVVCPTGRGSCRSDLGGYNHTQVDFNTSYVDIRSFNVNLDVSIWSCADGFSGTPSTVEVVLNVLPTGSLTWDSTCVSGRVTSPASLSCSGLRPGTPPASLAIVDSNNRTVNSSQAGSVTGTVTRGGQASCSVTWSDFPHFPLNIMTTQCDVQVAANVTVSVRNIPGQDKVITCQAEGHPDTYTYIWLQSWGGQEVRRVNGSQQGGQYNLTLTSYQDTGTYTCTVDNGVLDTSGQVIRRNASVNVTVEAAPVLPLPSDPPIVSGEDGEPVRLYRSLYASPALVNHTWFFNSTNVTSLIPGATTNNSQDLVLLPVHGTTVTTEGTLISLTLNVSQQYTGLYRLQACNTIGCTSTNVTLSFARSSSRLTQGTPCLSASSCRLRCSVIAGVNENGLIFHRNSLQVVACPGGRDGCRSELPDLYSHTQVDYFTSYVDIRSFDASRDATTWSCGDAPNGTLGTLQLTTNVLPSGSLTWGSTCVSGRVTSPASLSCSGLSPGTPNATLAIVDSGSQAVVSSQTGSVSGTVIRGGQASCSVTWSAIPSFPLSISPVLCEVQVVANISIGVQNLTSPGKVVTCQAEGHPGTYTFQPWLQAWGGQEVRTVTGSQQGGQYSLTLTSYQDTGTYTCTVDNGVLDSSGQIIRRTSTINATIEDVPILPLPSDPATIYGEMGEQTHLYRNLFSFPALTMYTWYYNSTDVTTVLPGATMNSSQTMVLLPVHDASVMTEGVVINLYVTLSPLSIGLYRLTACNRRGCRTTEFMLTEARQPGAPESLQGIPDVTRVVLSWIPGHPGGDFFQWFHVQYRRQDSQEGQWSDVSTADNRNSSDKTRVFVLVEDLDPDTSYVFRVRAQSSRRHQNIGEYASVTVKTYSAGGGLDLGAAVAVTATVSCIVTAAVTLLVVCAVIHCRQEAGVKKGNDPKRYNNAAFNDQGASGQPRARARDDPLAAASPRTSPEEGPYSDLDPSSMERPRVPPVYQPLGRPAAPGKVAAGAGGGRESQAYANPPQDEAYTNILDL